MTQHMIGKSFIEYHGDSAKCRTMFHNPVGVPINADGFYDPREKTSTYLSSEDGKRFLCQNHDGWRIEKKIEEQA
ncbi:MAG: hypothetical protein Ct9H90mP30_0810 [Actinomycetota bacterium]|nr:MAG: hypothetical protein Ct9H90mP30_0810 [Actinomycetota bacterium]